MLDGDFVVGVLNRPSWIRPARGEQSAPATSGHTSFLQRDLSEEALREPAEPVLTARDLEAVKQDSFEAGRAAGLAAAAGAQAAFRTAAEVNALEIISGAMNDAGRQASRAVDDAAAALAKSLIAAMDAVMPDLIGRSGLREVAAMLHHVLPGLSQQTNIRVEVAPAINDAIDKAMASLPPALRSQISVVAEDRLGPGDARVHWGCGHASRQPTEIWRAVMEALQPVLGEPATKDTDNAD